MSLISNIESIASKIESGFAKVLNGVEKEFLTIEPIAAVVITQMKPYVDAIVLSAAGTAAEKAVDAVMTVISAKLMQARSIIESVGMSTDAVSLIQSVHTNLPATLTLLGIKNATATAAANAMVTELTTITTAAYSGVAAVKAAVEEPSVQETAAAVITGQ